MKCFTADFETTTDLEDCRVWAYSINGIDDLAYFEYGNNIDDFFKHIEKNNGCYYFHNLKFDSSFIFQYLLQNGFKFLKSDEKAVNKSFKTCYTEQSQIYNIKIYFKVYKKSAKKVVIYDSLKLIPFSVENIAKFFDVDVKKLNIDYNKKREIGYKLNLNEIAYIRNDVYIVAKALRDLFNMSIDKMTIASSAMSFFKKSFNNFDKFFPKLELNIDKAIRVAYKGGFTFLNDIYKDRIIENGIVLDVNSLYPYVMREFDYPIGEPIYYEGEYVQDDKCPLYIQIFECEFEIKKDKIPCIQIKHSLYFRENEYLKSSGGDSVVLGLTNIDLKLFFEQYNVKNIKYLYGFKFHSYKGIFKNYIDYWSNLKIEAVKNKNIVLKTISKLMLNSLYGKFGTQLEGRLKEPYLEDGVLKFKLLEKTEKMGYYIPVACFVTSYARRITIETSQKIQDYSIKKYGVSKYVYSDTDSIHTLLNVDECLQFLNIDDSKLGFWKIEEKFKYGCYHRQKCYLHSNEEGEYLATVAGLPKRMSSILNFSNFKEGFTTNDEYIQNYMFSNSIQNKLRYKQTKGGVVLIDTDFTIK